VTPQGSYFGEIFLFHCFSAFSRSSPRDLVPHMWKEHSSTPFSCMSSSSVLLCCERVPSAHHSSTFLLILFALKPAVFPRGRRQLFVKCLQRTDLAHWIPRFYNFNLCAAPRLTAILYFRCAPSLLFRSVPERRTFQKIEFNAESEGIGFVISVSC